MGENNNSVDTKVFYCKSDGTDEWKLLGNAKSIEATFPEPADEPMIFGFDTGKTASFSCEVRVQFNQKAYHLSIHGKNRRIRKKNKKKIIKSSFSKRR